ncbi:MAG: hypothetical protein ACFCAD_23275 [Pleurocapsa sp.]
MEFLGIEHKILANQVFDTVDGLIIHRAFGFETIGITKPIKLLGKMIAQHQLKQSHRQPKQNLFTIINKM